MRCFFTSSYQEMIAHLPMNSHPNPKRVLVIGGGDGGVLREVTKHESVEEVTLCEIDEDVIEVSKQFLPVLGAGFDHPKVRIHIGDGFSFLEGKKGFYDVIITDSSDPVGPAESLFQRQFFVLMSKALRPGGVVCTQGECMWLHLPIIRKVIDTQRTLYPVVAYAYTTIPTYPSGQIGFILCCNDQSRDVRKPLRKWSPDEEGRLLRYYNADVHEAAYKLPQFAKAVLEN